ncbi:MAG: VOC family protein [Burkholderiales bacterium]|nr:VOC family protein [Burkholderiales bacterium]MCW5603477.1 VOC family protein [Burkholderiales bacterium]
MAKLRHIAMTVDDIQKTATFYEQAFDMKRVRESDVAVMLSDGVVSLAIIDANRNVNAEGRKGLHHFGFLIDDMESSAAQAEKAGAVYHGQIKNIGGGPKSERKYRDLNGLPFDIATPEHAVKVWCIPV